jgi:hypothetical protein
VLNDQDRHLAAQSVEGNEDGLGGRRGEPFERLVEVEEQRLDIAGERAGDGHHLLLAARRSHQTSQKGIPG